MDDEWVTPQEAVTRLLALHYPGRKTGNQRQTRMALIGAINAGQIEWRCEQWRETFFSESGAKYDENGGLTSSEPKWGSPADFWQPALASDTVFWGNNAFISQGLVTSFDASHDVRMWLGRNDEAWAKWERFADNVELNWRQTKESLGDAGWQSWVKPITPKRPFERSISDHYRHVLIALVGRAMREPDASWSRKAVFEWLHDEFDSYSKRIPDRADLIRLTRQVLSAIQPTNDCDGPPI